MEKSVIEGLKKAQMLSSTTNDNEDEEMETDVEEGEENLRVYEDDEDGLDK